MKKSVTIAIAVALALSAAAALYAPAASAQTPGKMLLNMQLKTQGKVTSSQKKRAAPSLTKVPLGKPQIKHPPIAP